ncbi:hypothetical protein BM526_19285 (plasmid) [Alteromonas mediterranea]|uniref:hypothetical protein n=1 Tax=Alteromonas mediterranea TaxID=314275 RepID=UPI00090438AC|nr:hypothetical protein [Alteromonas mediterranea]APE04114.1 hypothetical protein BM526_19285 [Alteromonas mediterranea]
MKEKEIQSAIDIVKALNELNDALNHNLEAANSRIAELERHVSHFNNQTLSLAKALGEERNKNAQLQGQLSAAKRSIKNLEKGIEKS